MGSHICYIPTLLRGFDMGRIDAIIEDDLEKKVRMKAVEKFGGKKGSLTEAIQEALEQWTAEKSKR